mmetsp:Transcript_110377/g.263047  ORF Transcript_110377/g.263047 Transcript_110377/m.263047 type:complete len:191 (-) Transcript_110377:1459-2031(-)
MEPAITSAHLRVSTTASHQSKSFRYPATRKPSVSLRASSGHSFDLEITVLQKNGPTTAPMAENATNRTYLMIRTSVQGVPRAQLTYRGTFSRNLSDMKWTQGTKRAADPMMPGKKHVTTTMLGWINPSFKTSALKVWVHAAFAAMQMAVKHQRATGAAAVSKSQSWMDKAPEFKRQSRLGLHREAKDMEN